GGCGRGAARPCPRLPPASVELAAHLGGGRDRRRRRHVQRRLPRGVRARLRDLDAAGGGRAARGAAGGGRGHGDGPALGLRRDRANSGPTRTGGTTARAEQAQEQATATDPWRLPMKRTSRPSILLAALAV